MRVTYYQLEVMIEQSFYGKSQALKYLNYHLLFKMKKLNKNNKSKTLIFKMKNKFNKLEYLNLNKTKKLPQKRWMTLNNKKMKETSSWRWNHGKEQSKNRLKYHIKVLGKLLQSDFNCNSHMVTEQKIAETIFDMSNKI